MKLDIRTISKEYSKKHILVVGDIILDAYVHGNVDRISQEAPVPIVLIDHKDFKPGGAANVALNLAGLGARVTLMGIVGKDENHEYLKNCFYEKNEINYKFLESESRPTSVKTRIIADKRQLARLDNEVTDEITGKDESVLVNSINKHIKNIDGVIIQDYNKGLLTPSLIKSIIECSNKNEVPVYVDPKFDNYSSYKGVRLFKPNLVEYKAITKEEEFGPLPKSGFRFKDRMNSEILLLTLGSSGMSLYFDGIHESIPTKARDVYDVSGAGDTVIATFALNDLCGLKPLESAIIANLAAGRVCEDIGVCPITIDSLIDFFSHHYSLDY
tara:strand:- start:12965 stop:13948 length:984 start_codon:yes stop_codon:yes gene_type:complete